MTLTKHILFRNILLIGLSILSFFEGHSQTANCFRVGAHAGCGPYYSNEHMFLNLFMQASSFSPAVASDTNGYPLSVTTTPVVSMISSGRAIVMDDSVYVCHWDGNGDVSVTVCCGAHSVSITNKTSTTTGGRFEFSVNYSEAPGDQTYTHVRMSINTSYTGNHVKNIRFYLKRFENLYEVQGEVFHPDYLKVMKNFKVYRYMGAFNTNNSTFKTWSDRTTPTYFNQTGGNKGCGLAYEWACIFSNRTNTNMWFNVPHAADNDAIRKMAQLVYRNLNPDLDIYLEYSNETWNTAGPYYQQFAYTQNYPGGHAALSRNTFRIWREVFGKDSLRVKRVLASIGVSDINHISWGRIQQTGLENFDVWSVSYYWGLINPAWCNINTAYNELQTSVRNTSGEWYKRMKAHSDMAKEIGKEMFCYEGGWGTDPALASTYSCLPIVQALQIDPRIEALTMEVMDTLKNLGISGGNELSVLGGWQENTINHQVGFWGLYDNASADPMTYPKYSGVIKSIENCDNMIRATDTIGSGLALRMDGVNDYVDANLAYKPNDITENYTIEAWVRPEYLGTDQYILSLIHIYPSEPETQQKIRGTLLPPTPSTLHLSLIHILHSCHLPVHGTLHVRCKRRHNLSSTVWPD